MQVATFNTCHGSMGAGTPTDLGRLVAACRSLDADVLGLQEVDRGTRRAGGADQAAVIADGLGLACVYVPADRVWGGSMGNALLVRGALADVERICLPGALRLRGRDRRSAVLARARVRDLSLTIAVVHLSTGVLDNIEQERRILDALVERPGPHLLLGDLNRRTAWVQPAASARGLHLVDDDARTAPRDSPRYRIDHVALSGLVARTSTVVDTGASDHRALVVDVGLPSVTAMSPH